MLARILHMELLVAHMHAEPDASEPPLPETAGFVVDVTVCVCRRASLLMELVKVARRPYHDHCMHTACSNIYTTHARS